MNQAELAEALRKEIVALVKKYEVHDHLTSFTSSLEEVVEEIDACIEDTQDVE